MTHDALDQFHSLVQTELLFAVDAIDEEWILHEAIEGIVYRTDGLVDLFETLLKGGGGFHGANCERVEIHRSLADVTFGRHRDP